MSAASSMLAHRHITNCSCVNVEVVKYVSCIAAGEGRAFRSVLSVCLSVYLFVHALKGKTA